MKKITFTFALAMALCAAQGFGTARADDTKTPDAPAPDAAANAPAPDSGQAPAAEPAPDQAAPAPAAEQAAPVAAPTTHDMLVEVHMGSVSLRYCTKIDKVVVETFKQCVADKLSEAGAKGTPSDAYQLGADYRAWAFMTAHVGDMHERGEEWSKEYRMANETEASYRQSVNDLMSRTGLPEKQVCDIVGGVDCPKQ
jgi:hypothetical protein